MKKLLALMLVLGVASVANATLLISVDGVVDPPDTSIELFPSDTVTIDIWGDGQESPQTTYVWLIPEGPATLSGGTMLYPGSLATWVWYAEGDGSDIVEWLQGEGYTCTQAAYAEILDGTVTPPALEGKLVDEIAFHCDGEGDVLLTLIYADLGQVFDTQMIHQIVPEPASMLLLGLGGLLLRRRK